MGKLLDEGDDEDNEDDGDDGDDGNDEGFDEEEEGDDDHKFSLFEWEEEQMIIWDWNQYDKITW